jgi:hypothetical protein
MPLHRKRHSRDAGSHPRQTLIVHFDDKAATVEELTRLLTDEPLRQKFTPVRH